MLSTLRPLRRLLILIVVFALFTSGSFHSLKPASASDDCAETLVYMQDHENGSDFTSPTGYTSSAHYRLEWALGTGSHYASGTRWFANNYGVTVEQRLESPAIPIPADASDTLFLRFNHAYNTEPGVDGGIVEISVNGGAFTDVGTAAFTQNGYNRPLSGGTVLGIRDGFSAESVGFPATITSVIDLSGIAGAGDTLAVRFRFASSDNQSGIGWYVDDVSVGYCAGSAQPVVSISPSTSAVEGDGGAASAAFTVSITPTVPEDVIVSYATVDDTATTADGDYVTQTGTLTIPSNAAAATLTLADMVQGDTKYEPDETFLVTLTSVTTANAALSPTAMTGTATITNDDAVPTISIADSSASEDDGVMVFTLTLSNPTYLAVSVEGQTAAGTATAPDDYTHSAWSVTFDPGETSKAIGVTLTDDGAYEPTETFSNQITNVTNANAGSLTAVGTILDNDPAPNQPPVNTAPLSVITDEDTPLIFSVGTSSEIGISDPDAGDNAISVVLTATNGVLSPASMSGLTVSGSGTGSLSLGGMLADVNAALNGLTYTPNLNYHGSDSLQIETSDLGSTGAGGAQTDSDIVSISVQPVNDDPVVTISPADADQTVLSGEVVTVSASYDDVDNGDTHSATIDWGDAVIDNVPASSDMVSGSHTYASAGVYSVTITLADQNGGQGAAVATITVNAPTFTPTPTPTWTPTPTETPTETSTNTPTSTPTETPTPTSTWTPTPTATATYTPTMTPSQTVTPSPTVTPSETMTATPTLVPTETLDSHTPTPTATATATATATTSAAPTQIPGVVRTPDFVPPPAAPLAQDVNANADGVVRAGVPDRLRNDVNVRELVVNGEYVSWMGSPVANSGFIGNQGVLDLGVQQAIDVFSPTGLSYFEGGAVFCLRGEGTLIYLNANNAPRHPEIVGSYTVPDFPGFTCVTLFEPGTLVLVDRIE